MYIRWAMKISLVAPVKHSQPYLENDLAPPLDLHYLRISPWLWFRYIEFYRQGRLKLDELVSQHMKLEQLNEGNVARSVITFD